MNDTTLNLTDPFTRGLACAALSSGLRNILIFDITAVALRSVAEILKQMLMIATEYKVDELTLGTTETDDDLWGSLTLKGDGDGKPVWHQDGLFIGSRNGSCLQLIIIPDLTRISLAAARACVMLMDSTVTHIERHGHHAHWQPNVCFLAASAKDDVGRISPHLLDRFALRLSQRRAKNEDKATEILGWISKPVVSEKMKRASLPDNISDRLQNAARCWPQVATEAKASILDYFPKSEAYNPRREIALARLAFANTRIDNKNKMTPEDVVTVASIMGLKPVVGQRDEAPQPHVKQIEENEKESEPPTTSDTKPSSVPPSLDNTSLEKVKEPVYESDTLEPFSSSELPLNPYPEDQAPVEREAASLRLPLHYYKVPNNAHGPVIGVECAKNLYDLALVATFLEAAKFQSIRKKHRQHNGSSLLLSPRDLRSYKRAPVPEQVLVLLLDYTCLQGCKWQEVLIQYLKWAYVERASISVIQVGAATAKHDLRAERLNAPSILMPCINAALEAERGKSTPLAHGLDLAQQTLQHALQHGRNAARHALFVLLSDGRGNIPLEVSRAGRVTFPINREGIEDTFKIAKHISSLHNVRSIFLNPQPRQYVDLPLKLAEELGAAVVTIPYLETDEVT